MRPPVPPLCHTHAVRSPPLLHGPRLVVIALTLAGAGCILFVNDDPSKLTTTCHFEGDTTVCGLCVSAACTKPLDACCGDATCSAISLPLLGECFAGPLLCGSLLEGAPGLASCIASSCPACASADGGGVGPPAEGGA